MEVLVYFHDDRLHLRARATFRCRSDLEYVALADRGRTYTDLGARARALAPARSGEHRARRAGSDDPRRFCDHAIPRYVRASESARRHAESTAERYRTP